MDHNYSKNGLVFWNADEIRMRRVMEEHFVAGLTNCLKSLNRAWEFVQIEAPILTPRDLINKNYTDDNIFVTANDLALRPETTMGSYAYAEWLIATQRMRPPICVWQHGKSFRQEQDQVVKNMRLKEFYQLEFQCIYSLSTKADYSAVVVPNMCKVISQLLGECKVEDSERLPDYAHWTKDIVCRGMEVCSISLRKDLKDMSVLEVAIGTDRCVYNFYNKGE